MNITCLFWLRRIGPYCFACILLGANAQSRIEGRILNERLEPLAYANVLLLNASDSTFNQGVITNDAGQYLLDGVRTGKYFLVITSIGYRKEQGDVFSVGDEGTYSHDLTLAEESVQLNEIMIQAEKPIFEQKVDRLVVNVQNSVTSTGNTALEVLQKSPGIVVNRQNNTINMNGKSGVRVMINGKMMQLPITAVVQMLDGMSASNIDMIELITTPPAQYDAEGDAGIIHIVLKENVDLGTSGTMGLVLGYRWAENLGGNIGVTHRGKKAAYFLDYSVNRNRNRHFWKMYRKSWIDDFQQYVTDTSNRKNTTTIHNLRAGAEWKTGEKSELSLLLTAYGNKWTMDAVTRNNNVVDANTTIYTIMDIYELNDWRGSSAGVRWETSPGAKSHLSFDFDYLQYANNNPSDYVNTSTLNSELSPEELIDVKKSTPIFFLIGKADYTFQPTASLGFDAGVKVVHSELDNDVSVDRFQNGEWTSDPRFTSFAHLQERIGAAYFSGRYQTESGVQLNAGIRYERTSTLITTPSEGEVLNRNYGNFFPSLFVQKSLGKEQDIQFSYSRRITRPTFNDIAPFVLFWNPNTFSSGNTSLWPAVADAVKASFHLKAWIASLQYSHSRHEIAFFQPEVDEDNTLIYRSQNLQYLNSLSFSNSYSVDIVKGWQVQTNLNGQYQTARTEHLEENTSLSIFNFNANVVTVITLPRNFTIELSGFYNSKMVWGISTFMPRSSINAGIQKKFNGNKGVLSLSIDDIFYDAYWRVETDLPQLNLDSRIVYDWHNRYVRLAYTWNFGNRKLRSINIESGSEEERRRVN